MNKMTSVNRFYNSVKSDTLKQGELIDLFIYHLTIELGESSATTKRIAECFSQCDLKVPARLSVHLSEGLRKPTRYIKKNSGYRLENKRRKAIDALMGHDRAVAQTSATLRNLEQQVQAGPKREFLRETLDCFMAGANRAVVVMAWNLALHHMQEVVLKKHLSAFNSALAKNTDSRVKIKSVVNHDSFTEMPENKFLLFCRESKIITGSIFKKMENKLDERNAAAHPSGVTITSKFAESYVDDLIENTVLKYKL